MSTKLSPEQQQRFQLAKDGLRGTVETCASDLLMQNNSEFIKQANQGIEFLTLAEASWLNQKQWNPTEKTLLLCHVDMTRNKKKKKLPLFKIALLGNLAIVAATTQHKGYKHLAAMSAVIAAATALDIMLDCIKETTVNKMTKQAIHNCAQKNDNIRTGIRCLSPRLAHDYRN